MPVITSSVLDPNRPVLPEWTRWAWASMADRELWRPLINEAVQAWFFIERLAVIEHVRPAAYQPMQPNRLLEETAHLAKFGLTVLPIAQMNTTHSYSSATNGFDPTQPWEYRVLIVPITEMAKIASIPNLATNNEALGEILGYPKCCIDFFLRTWGAGQVDTTWDQYAETGSADGPIEANLLWRWKGIRWVSHLPCSYQCEHTVAIGKQMREVALKHGYVEETRTIDAVLSWPVRWSGVNGIAEIVSPYLKVSTRTDWAPPSDHRRFQRTGQEAVKTDKTFWTHNGFSSHEYMRQVHVPIIQAIKEFTPQNASVVDLGCGNGALLRRAKLYRSDIKIAGIDINEEAIQTVAKETMSRKWLTGKIQEGTWTTLSPNPAETVLVSCPVRLCEMTDEEKTQTLTAMQRYPIQIVYVYGDNLQRHSLEQWVELAGLPVDKLLMIHFGNTNVAVGVLQLS